MVTKINEVYIFMPETTKSVKIVADPTVNDSKIGNITNEHSYEMFQHHIRQAFAYLWNVPKSEALIEIEWDTIYPWEE